MPPTLATASNVIHTHAASGYEVTNCNLTHYSKSCKPGYPHASIFFFDVGTEAGLVANNTGYARCTSFVGYSASGVVLEVGAAANCRRRIAQFQFRIESHSAYIAELSLKTMGKFGRL